MERREKERKDRTKVEFVSGTVKKTASGSSVSGMCNFKLKTNISYIMQFAK